MKNAAALRSEPRFSPVERGPEHRIFSSPEYKPKARQSAVQRALNTVIAYASHRDGLEGLAYLWAAPAAAGVVGLFVSLVALDQYLGGRVLNFPPSPTLMELKEGQPDNEVRATVPSIMEAEFMDAAQITGQPDNEAQATAPSITEAEFIDAAQITFAPAIPSREAAETAVPEEALNAPHAKESAPEQEVVLQSVAKPEPAAALERIEASPPLERPPTPSVFRERPDQQVAPRPILGDATDGDSAGGGVHSGSETTSEKSSADKVTTPDTNSLPNIADVEPDSPKTNSEVATVKPVKQALKKAKPAAENAKREENRTVKPAEESTVEQFETPLQGVGQAERTDTRLERQEAKSADPPESPRVEPKPAEQIAGTIERAEQGAVAGIVDRVERTPERSENKMSETKGPEKVQRTERASETESVGTAELTRSPALADRVERAPAKVERALEDAVERPPERSGTVPERPAQVERLDVSKIERPEQVKPVERLQRVEHAKVERPERVERVEQRPELARPERVERAEKVQRPEKPERIERKLVEKVERILRPERR